MDPFLETHDQQKLTHGEIENLNKTITKKGNESVIKNLPKKKSSKLEITSLENSTKYLKTN